MPVKSKSNISINAPRINSLLKTIGASRAALSKESGIAYHRLNGAMQGLWKVRPEEAQAIDESIERMMVAAKSKIDVIMAESIK